MTACRTSSEYLISILVLIGSLLRKRGPASIRPCSTIGPRHSAGKNVERRDDQDDPEQHEGERQPVGRQRSRRRWHGLLRGEAAGNRQHREDHAEPADEHRRAEGQIVEIRVGVQAGEGAAVVVRGRGVGVEDFAQPVRAAVVQARQSGRQAARDRRTQ